MSGLGAARRHFRLTDSTNDRARELAIAGAPSGLIVTADEQSAGRGRHGRVWSAPAGKALLASAILRPLDERHLMLPLAVPVAVCEAIEALAPVECQIKWPNDIWIDERKVSGILIEARPPEWAVIGVGINVSVADDEFPEDVRWPAMSIGRGTTVDALLEALCARLEGWVVAPEADVRTAFAQRDALSGREISWDGGIGRAAGIDERGNLVVESTDGERISLGAGEVSLRIT